MRPRTLALSELQNEEYKKIKSLLNDLKSPTKRLKKNESPRFGYHYVIEVEELANRYVLYESSFGKEPKHIEQLESFFDDLNIPFE